MKNSFAIESSAVTSTEAALPSGPVIETVCDMAVYAIGDAVSPMRISDA